MLNETEAIFPAIAFQTMSSSVQDSSQQDPPGIGGFSSLFTI